MGVGCIGLFGGDTTLIPRGARNHHDPPLAPTTRGSHQAPLAGRNCLLPRDSARQPSSSSFATSRRRLRITRRPAPLKVDVIVRVGGRVHAVVSWRFPFNRLILQRPLPTQACPKRPRAPDSFAGRAWGTRTTAALRGRPRAQATTTRCGTRRRPARPARAHRG
jgi:hypothetical protein